MKNPKMFTFSAKDSQKVTVMRHVSSLCSGLRAREADIPSCSIHLQDCRLTRSCHGNLPGLLALSSVHALPILISDVKHEFISLAERNKTKTMSFSLDDGGESTPDDLPLQFTCAACPFPKVPAASASPVAVTPSNVT